MQKASATARPDANPVDSRTDILKKISRIVYRHGTVFLIHPVDVLVDEIGGDVRFTVRRVSSYPGASSSRLDFFLGKDRFGSDVSTDGVLTEDLSRILAEIPQNLL